MNPTLPRIASLLSLTAVVLTGCGKKGDDGAGAVAPAPVAKGKSTAAPGKETLPGENSVRDAMTKKEYERAVGSLLALKGAAVGETMTAAYLVLYDEVKFGLMDASASDPKAANALMMLRAATAGR